MQNGATVTSRKSARDVTDAVESYTPGPGVVLPAFVTKLLWSASVENFVPGCMSSPSECVDSYAPGPGSFLSDFWTRSGYPRVTLGDILPPCVCAWA